MSTLRKKETHKKEENDYINNNEIKEKGDISQIHKEKYILAGPAIQLDDLVRGQS